MGGLPAGPGPLRRRILPHCAGRSRTARSATANAARGLLGGDRGRGIRPPRPQREPYRCLCRDHDQRLPEPHFAARERWGPGVPFRHRKQLRDRHRPGGLHPGARGAGDFGGHRVLVLARGDAPGRRRPPAGRGGPGARRRRERHPAPGADAAPDERRDAVSRRAVQDVRRCGERIRARRRVRDRGVEAARGRRAGSGPNPRGAARLGGESRRGERRIDGAKRERPGTGHRRGARARRGRARFGGLPGGARDRDRTRGPDRAARRRRGVRQGPDRRAGRC